MLTQFSSTYNLPIPTPSHRFLSLNSHGVYSFLCIFSVILEDEKSSLACSVVRSWVTKSSLWKHVLSQTHTDLQMPPVVPLHFVSFLVREALSWTQQRSFLCSLVMCSVFASIPGRDSARDSPRLTSFPHPVILRKEAPLPSSAIIILWMEPSWLSWVPCLHQGSLSTVDSTSTPVAGMAGSCDGQLYLSPMEPGQKRQGGKGFPPKSDSTNG